jgi:hypothetical protein
MERKVHYHGYTIERTSGPNEGLYTIWDGTDRIDKGTGFNSVVEAQVYINRMESRLRYFETDYRKALEVTTLMLNEFLENHPEYEAYFSTRAPARFAEAVSEEMARLRSFRTGEDLDD